MKASGLHIVSSFDQMVEPITIETKQAGLVSFYGMPYSDPESVKHHFQQPVSTHDEAHQLLADKIKDCFISEHKNVLVSHCFVDGAIESDSERPLSIGGSDRVSHEHFVDFDYVALGHLHQPQKKGAEYIRYSGSLMKYSFSEQHHKKGMTLVEFDKDGFKTSEHIDLKPRHDMRVIEGNMDEILQAAKSDPNNEDYVLVRLMDKHAILEPMEKFRTVYPNILHLEKPGMLVGVEQELGAASLKRSEIDMFEDFFQEAQKSSLNEAQKEVIEQVIQQLTCQSES